jgi:hypothetical protein
MKTQISQFCNEFSEVLAPLSATLRQAIDGLNQVKDGQSLGDVLPGLADVSLRLRALTDKVEGQEAYVLVFGPLKSGKSTLLNAISSAYVSEVTSLPAYPCMVHVKYAETPNYTLHRYDGSTQTVSGGEGLRDRIEEAHLRLAQRLREVEEEGGQFEPARDLPEAIRRIVVELPAENLRESGTVLVDTPGLYSRMKFGYDLMTREFRNSAASAVFVVKTDNLFLEQVFADFNDLLGMFSRVFVVVNLDGNKQDLGPDGMLAPSLEKEDPGRIIEAFESLTMSAELRRAMEAGRLRIYPVDLLQAASASLRGESATDGDPFGAFLGDLTEYLNSTDYMTEFMGDSLRQGEGLCEEIAAHQESAALQQVRQRQQALQDELDDLDAVILAVTELRNLNWTEMLNPVRETHVAWSRRFGSDLKANIASSLDRAVDQWLDSDDSLLDLQSKYLNPLLRQSASDIAKETSTRLAASVEEDGCGVELPPPGAEWLEGANLSLSELRAESLASIDTAADPLLFSIAIDYDEVPVKRGLFDLALFRSVAAIRRKLFGSAENPASPIPSSTKQRRIGVDGQDAKASMRAIVEAHLNKLFPSAVDRRSRKLVDQYIAAFAEKAVAALESMHDRLSDRRMATSGQKADHEETVALLDQLNGANALLLEAIGNLSEKHDAGERQIEAEGLDDPERRQTSERVA